MTLTTFYRGRPTRGARLTPLYRVLWSGVWEERPWRMQAPAGYPVYSRKGWHDINRVVKERG